jgi:nucleotide-binding universal stress UspA family protein
MGYQSPTSHPDSGKPMFSTIVVGTDGSETAPLAVAQAVQLARQSGAKLHLVAAYQTPTTVADPVSGAIFGQFSSLEEQRQAAQEMLEEVAGGFDGLEIEIHMAPGPPATVIVDHASEVGADLIVVGSKGMQGTRRIMGSVPNSVAHTAGCHVLIAKTT